MAEARTVACGKRIPDKCLQCGPVARKRFPAMFMSFDDAQCVSVASSQARKNMQETVSSSGKHAGSSVSCWRLPDSEH